MNHWDCGTHLLVSVAVVADKVIKYATSVGSVQQFIKYMSQCDPLITMARQRQCSNNRKQTKSKVK